MLQVNKFVKEKWQHSGWNFWLWCVIRFCGYSSGQTMVEFDTIAVGWARWEGEREDVLNL